MRRFETEIEILRERVDTIDTKLLALLNARAAVVTNIYSLKEQHGAPRFNRARTDAILQRLVEDNQGPLTAPEVRELFLSMLQFFVQRYRAGESTAAFTAAAETSEPLR